MTQADQILETILQLNAETISKDESDQKISEALGKMRQAEKLTKIKLLSPFKPVTDALKRRGIEGKWYLTSSCDSDTCEHNLSSQEQGIFKVCVPEVWLTKTDIDDNCVLYELFNILTSENLSEAGFPERSPCLIMIIPTKKPKLIYKATEYNDSVGNTYLTSSDYLR